MNLGLLHTLDQPIPRYARVYLAVTLDGIRGPHQGIADGRLPSGRVRVLIPDAGGRRWVVVTDAANVTEIIDHHVGTSDARA